MNSGEKQIFEERIVKMMSDICCLEESQVSDNHPLVSDLKKEIIRFEEAFGESVRTKLLASDFTFDDIQKRLMLLEKSILLIERNHFDSFNPERGSPQDILNSIDDTENYLAESGGLDADTSKKLLNMKYKVSSMNQ